MGFTTTVFKCGLSTSLALLLVMTYGSCKLSDPENNAPAVVRANCGSCHLVPEPSSLTSEIWRDAVIPQMSEYFLWTERSTLYPYANKAFYRLKGQIPMNDRVWSTIMDYYLEEGLDSVRLRPEASIPVQDLFREELVRLNGEKPEVTALSIDPGKNLAVAHHGLLTVLDPDLQKSRKYDIQTQVTHIVREEPRNNLMLLDVGQLDPHEGSLGGIQMLNLDSGVKEQVLSGLQRPVRVKMTGDTMYVAEFGYYTGKMSRHILDSEQKPDILHTLPGTYKIEYAKVGLNEEKQLVFTLGQGQEGLYSLDNRDSIKALLRFPPEYGLSDMDVADLDGDGLDEFLIANGDNADYSIMPKAFHGVRVHRQEGDGSFRTVFEYPVYGATQARFIDADRSNGLDIIASCYFSERGNESIVLLLNKGGFTFDAYRFDQAPQGRWMVMEVADVNSDGWSDVVIGSYTAGPHKSEERTEDQNADLLLLMNRGRKEQ